jgi:protein-tyrosine phosphatase
VQPEDFRRFDYIVAMDQSNLAHLEEYREAVGGEAVLYLLREFDPEGGPGAEVPDPYYGGPNGFEEVFDIVDRSCREFLEFVLQEAGAGK